MLSWAPSPQRVQAARTAPARQGRTLLGSRQASLCQPLRASVPAFKRRAERSRSRRLLFCRDWKTTRRVSHRRLPRASSAISPIAARSPLAAFVSNSSARLACFARKPPGRPAQSAHAATNRRQPDLGQAQFGDRGISKPRVHRFDATCHRPPRRRSDRASVITALGNPPQHGLLQVPPLPPMKMSPPVADRGIHS